MMTKIKSIVFSCLTLLLLNGCAASHPKIITFTPASIVVDYGDSSLYEATRVAQQYCDSIRKDAQYVRTESTWYSGAKEGFFNCIESASKTGAGAGGSASGGYGGHGPIINNITPPVINNNSNH